MLRSVRIGGSEPLRFEPEVIGLWGDRALIPAALGYAAFDVRSPFLPGSGTVDVEIAGPLDGRLYLLRRALDVPDHWQVIDVETGWLASGTADTAQWLRSNLEVASELSLSDLFREHLTVSVPVMVAWLAEQIEQREAKLRQWLRTQHYVAGLNWLSGVRTQLDLDIRDAQAAVTECEAVDASFDQVRKVFDVTRRESLAMSEHVDRIGQELAQAREARERLDSLQADLDELRQELDARRLTVASLEAHLERWQEWQATHERAQRSLEEHSDQLRTYEEACVAVGKLIGELASLESLRIELQNVAASALALHREETLLEGHMAAIRQAESEAADLADQVEQQRQLEQQQVATQERAIRLEVISRALQQSIAESKRTEVLLADTEHQLEEIDQVRDQAARIKKLQNELEAQQELARDTARQVDHLRFLDMAARSVTGHLDDLRKGASATERLAVAANGGSGPADGEQRTVAGHLREAINHQMEALERQIRDWQVQGRDLSGAPVKLNQLRATIHQLEQEIESARAVEVKLGGVPALKQHRKYLVEHVDDLKKSIERRLKEQQDCSDAPARLAQLRQELSGLHDPRAQQQALLRTAARKHAVESDLRQVQRRRAEGEERQKTIEAKLAALKTVQDEIKAQERRRDENHEGYCIYLSQQAIADVSAGAAEQLERTKVDLERQRKELREAEARETSLLSEMEPLRAAAAPEHGLGGRLQEAEARAAEWKERYQASADRHGAAEANRVELGRRRVDLVARERAIRLLETAQSDVEQASVSLGSQLRREMADAATPIVRQLTGDDGLGFVWPWREAPALVRAGTSRSLDELDPALQAYCALSLRLAMAAEASRVRTVWLTDLGPLKDVQDIGRRLARVTEFQQFLVPSA